MKSPSDWSRTCRRTEASSHWTTLLNTPLRYVNRFMGPTGGMTSTACLLQVREERPSCRSSTCSKTTPLATGSADTWGRSTCWLKRCGSGSTTGAKYLGDTDYVDVDLARLTSKEFVEPFCSRIDREATTASSELGEDIITRSESTKTTHYSVVDGAGNMVANTYTIEQSYGSRVVAKGTGFLLNNEMHDFNMNPGVTDTKGMIGTPPNLIAPGKRMLSSLSPTLVLRDGSAFLATGSLGGRTIINTVVQVIVNVIDFGMDVQAAVDEPRIDHQWMPDRVTMEEGLVAIESAMQRRGHRTRMMQQQGDAHSILVVDGRLYAGVDRRLRGAAAGY